jgi:ArsR family transcriptional regulator
MKYLSKIFKALSDHNRLRILKMLEIKPLCVCEITEVLQLATSTVSKHLSILRDANFIADEKEGKWVIYRLNKERQENYINQLLPLLQTWLSEDTIIMRDREMVKSVDRKVLCGN